MRKKEMKKKEIRTEKTVEELRFTKKQLISSKKFKDLKDVLAVLLTENKTYGVQEAEEIVQKFMKGKVN